MYYSNVKNELISYIRIANEKKNNSVKDAQWFKTIYGYYDNIKKISSDNDVQNFLSTLYADIRTSIANYDKYYAEYQELERKNATIPERNEIAIIINNYKYEADTIKYLIENINRLIAEQKFKRTNPVKQESKQEKKPEVQNQNEKAKTAPTVIPENERYSKEFLNNEYTLDYLLYTKMIREDYQKLSRVRPGSTEEKELRSKLYKDVTGRRSLISDLFGESDVFKDAHSNLLYIESQERLLYKEGMLSEIREEDLDYNDCYNRINECLIEISDLHFADQIDGRKLRDANNQFENIIMSINDIVKSKKIKEIARDLLNLASAYNLDDDYKKFESHYKGKKIGTEPVSKNLYRKGMEEVKTKLNELFSELLMELSDKKVHIKSHDKSFKEKEKELYRYHYRICNGLLKLNMAKSL